MTLGRCSRKQRRASYAGYVYRVALLAPWTLVRGSGLSWLSSSWNWGEGYSNSSERFLSWGTDQAHAMVDELKLFATELVETYGPEARRLHERLKHQIDDVNDVIIHESPVSDDDLHAAMKELREQADEVRQRAEEDNLQDSPAALDSRKWLEQEEARLQAGAARSDEAEGLMGGNFSDPNDAFITAMDALHSETPAPPVTTTEAPDPSEIPLWGISARDRLEEGPVPHSKGKVMKWYKKKKMKQYDKSICAGQILEISMFTAEIPIQVLGAIRDCNPARTRTGVQSSQCARQIFVIMRAISRITRSVIIARAACSEAKHIACPNAIADLLARMLHLSEFGSRMGIKCRPDLFVSTDRRAALECAQRLEILSWAIGPFVGDLTHSARVCTADPVTKKPLRDYAWCVGEVLSVLGYVAATSLEIYYAPSACNTDGARCSEAVIEGIHALSLGAEKADLAAGFCGGFDTRCGSDIALLAAALTKAGIYASKAAYTCPGAIRTRARPEEIRCTDAITNIVKFVSVVAAKAEDASGRCVGDNDATQQCGSGIAKALAAFAFIANQMSLAVLDCSAQITQTDPVSWYNCGRNLDRIGYSSRIVSQGIAIAYINCKIGPDIDSITKPLALPARFYV